jgi:hypothetical protein
MTFHIRRGQIIETRYERVKAGSAGARRLLLPACAALWCAAALCSCELIQGPDPIQLLGAEIVIGTDAAAGSTLVSMHYTLRNSGSKDISTVHISFYMYDTSGNPVPGGNNYFDITFSSPITAGSQVTGATSLDSAFFYKPAVDLIANQFHIYKIEFSDGSSWTDWLGQYVYPYNVTSVPGS